MNQSIHAIILLTLFSFTSHADTVLVSIGDNGQVTEQQLESAMRAAPFATQFPAMEEQEQAYLRGDMLLRLARSEALHQEALNNGIQQQSAFIQEMSNFKTSLLAQQYLLKFRNQIQIPEAINTQLEKSYQSNPDAITAAQSAYVAKRFSEYKKAHIEDLKKQAHIKTHYSLLDDKPSPESVLAEGRSVNIKYGDLFPTPTTGAIDKTRVIEKVEEWIALILMAQQAEQQNIDIAAQLQDYARHLAVKILLAKQEKQWIPDEATLQNYFKQHPEIGYIPERRQIGQIVLADRQQAESIAQRINKGESLFTLAAEHSIDPYGKQRSGDMGWLTEGSAAPAIETALKNLQDHQISDIIETEKGWHIVTILNRKPSEQKTFAEIFDRVRQKFISEKMTGYLKRVTQKYPLQWHIAEK